MADNGATFVSSYRRVPNAGIGNFTKPILQTFTRRQAEFFECGSNVTMSGGISNVIMSGDGKYHPDDGRAEASNRYREGI